MGYGDSLRQGTDKINAVLDHVDQQTAAAVSTANDAKQIANDAKQTAEQALDNSEATQHQLDTIVIDGDSSVEAAQARVSTPKDKTFTVLKDRLDEAEQDLITHKAETVKVSGDQTIFGTKTFNSPIRAGGDHPLVMLGRPVDTAGKRNYRFDIKSDLLRLQALNDSETWVGELMELNHDGTVVYFGNRNIAFYWGSGSPEGVLSARVGAIYINTSGNTTTTLYVKESGTGNTGWVAK